MAISAWCLINSFEHKRKPVTREGYTKLSGEHKKLWGEERPRVIKAIQIAASEGDRSENAEYIYGRKRLREIDKRLRYLDYLLKDARIISREEVGCVRISFGAYVQLETSEGELKAWRIVGEGESDHTLGWISWKAPVAKSLLGKVVDDIVRVRTPQGLQEYHVLAISKDPLPR